MQTVSNTFSELTLGFLSLICRTCISHHFNTVNVSYRWKNEADNLLKSSKKICKKGIKITLDCASLMENRHKFDANFNDSYVT